MASLIACEGTWQQSPDGYLLCAGTLTVVADPALTLDDALQLKDSALMLFVIVFGFLALKKAIS